MTRRWSLRTRFVLAASACLLPLIGVVAYVLVQSLEHSSNQLIDTEEAVANVVAQGMTQTLSENEEVLRNVAAEDAVRRLDPEGSLAEFEVVRAARPSLAGLFLVDARGNFVVPPALDIERIRPDYDAVLQKTLSAGETGISRRLSIDGNEVIAIFVPVRRTDTEAGSTSPTPASAGAPATPGAANVQAAAPIGAVGALLSVERLARTFTPFASALTEITIATPDQVIATSAPAEGDSRTVRLAEPIGRALEGATGTYEYQNVDGKERLLVYTPVAFDAADWAVLVSAPTPRTYPPNQDLIEQGLAALALAVLATLLLALLLGEITARPLRQLTAQAAALAEGDFTQRIAPTGGGEVHSLSIAFREMEDRLATQVRALDDARRDRERQAEELRDLNRRTVRLQEEERRRIAADIHDAVSPLITGALYQTRAIRLANDGADPADHSAGLDAAADLLERAGAELHGVIFALRPPDLDDIGAVAAIERYMASTQRHGLTCRLEAGGEPPGLTPDARLGVYRIVQEALHNVMRHAGADECLVRIESSPDLLRVVVRDNGRGFDPERAQGPMSLGILSMRERAAAIGATVEIASKPGGGTVVVIERPSPGAVVTALEGEALAELETESPPEADQEASPEAVAETVVMPPRRASRRIRPGRPSRIGANGEHFKPGNDGPRVSVVASDGHAEVDVTSSTASPDGDEVAIVSNPEDGQP